MYHSNWLSLLSTIRSAQLGFVDKYRVKESQSIWEVDKTSRIKPDSDSIFVDDYQRCSIGVSFPFISFAMSHTNFPFDMESLIDLSHHYSSWFDWTRDKNNALVSLCILRKPIWTTKFKENSLLSLLKCSIYKLFKWLLPAY
jgi:hypothetical protein